MKLVEIPNFCDLSMESNDPYQRDRDQWPLFRTEGAGAIMAHIDAMLRFYARKRLPAVLCFYFHPWEFYEMPQGLIHFGEGSVRPDPFIVKTVGRSRLRNSTAWWLRLKERGAEFLTARKLARQF